MEPVYIYRATCHRVIDGDTYELDIDLGFKVYARITVRLRDVDAPELPTADGLRAKAAAQSLLMLASPLPQIVVQSYKGRRSFERWVCDVWLPDGRSLADVMVESGNAVRV